MAKKTNISSKKLLGWDQYKVKPPDHSLASVYDHISRKSQEMCNWYWISIRGKKRMSLVARAIAIALLIVGTILPIYSATQEDIANRLCFTQWGVALLVIAGLVTLSDRVFGWSSGWMRYIYTVTTMENLTRAFELEWARYIAFNNSILVHDDVKYLFDLSIALEQELTKLQAEETSKWISEFNTSISLLESMIKTQREETEKKLDVIRTTLSNRADAAKEEEKSRLPGAIEVSFTYKGDPVKLKIGLDSQDAIDFLGYTWAKVNVVPGQHLLSVEVMSDPPNVINKAVDVQPGVTTHTQIKL